MPNGTVSRSKHSRDANTLTTHHSPLTTHHSPLTTHYSLLTTHYSLLTTHHSLLTRSLLEEMFGRMPEMFLKIHHRVILNRNAFPLKCTLHVFWIRKVETATQVPFPIDYTVCRYRTVHDTGVTQGPPHHAC